MPPHVVVEAVRLGEMDRGEVLHCLAAGSVLNFVYLAWSMGFQILKR